MGLFTKAAQKSKTEQPTKSKKSTVWLTANSRDSEALSNSVHEMVRLQGEINALEAKQNIHKTVLKKHAESEYLREYAAIGVSPETPMIVQNPDGEKVTYVVQDRTKTSKVKDEQVEELAAVFGQDAANDLLYNQLSFSFNSVLLAKPGVQDAVEKALEKVIGALVGSGKLTEEESAELVQAESMVAFRPGLPARLAEVCGRDTNRMKSLIDIMGSAIVRYIKA